MKQKFLIILWFFGFTLGRAELKEIYLQSSVLKETVPVKIYFSTSQKLIETVIYLFHGLDGDQNSWFKQGELEQQLDQAIAKNLLPPLIVVSPAAKNSWYANRLDGAFSYENFVVQELVPQIERLLSSNRPLKKPFFTKNSRFNLRHRFVGGLSMGGFGGLHLTLNHPELFEGVLALSAAIKTPAQMLELSQMRYLAWFGSIFGENLIPEERLNQHYQRYDPLSLITSAEKQKLKFSHKFFLDIGLQDSSLVAGNKEFFQKINSPEKSNKVRLLLNPGQHNWQFWRERIIPDLKVFLEY